MHQVACLILVAFKEEMWNRNCLMKVKKNENSSLLIYFFSEKKKSIRSKACLPGVEPKWIDESMHSKKWGSCMNGRMDGRPGGQ